MASDIATGSGSEDFLSSGPLENLLTNNKLPSEITRTNTYSPVNRDTQTEEDKEKVSFQELLHRQPLYQTSFGGVEADSYTQQNWTVPTLNIITGIN
jgi:outer membrane phospholipase A